jgi:hypothetical protein
MLQRDNSFRDSFSASAQRDRTRARILLKRSAAAAQQGPGRIVVNRPVPGLDFRIDQSIVGARRIVIPAIAHLSRPAIV